MKQKPKMTEKLSLIFNKYIIVFCGGYALSTIAMCIIGMYLKLFDPYLVWVVGTAIVGVVFFLFGRLFNREGILDREGV
jgi:hypothetical protein